MAQLTVSELIKQLQKIEAKHGDAGVVARAVRNPLNTDEVIVEEIAIAEDGDVVLKECD